ncbi:MAG TPA: lipoate--protein ligase family protein, partial [Bacteroidales bacterium]|nr:lipoate--protein ligase family protein [Bacteroidales bacterium]
MFCINNQNTNPYFNLASEEYLLKNYEEDVFMLWRNEPSIIIGKHQNALAEINIEYVKENHIKVVRRITGGGAVFHDLGNLNFTFISNSPNSKPVMNFKKYTQPIVDVLVNLGVDARFEGRNDIVIDGKKISGNAECVYKNRFLHHGTI